MQGLDVWRVGVLAVVIAGVAWVCGVPVYAGAGEREATAKAAGHLLWRATRPAPGRGQSEARDSLLRALRALEDPAVRPVFDRLMSSGDVGLRMHGVMGLSELAGAGGAREMDLAWLEGFERSEQRWEVIGAALDEGLLPRAKAEQLLAWDGLDDGVKCLIAVGLIAEGWRGDTGFIRSAMTDESAGKRGLAALLLLAIGDESGLPALDWLATRPAHERAVVEVMLVNTARRHGLTETGGWVLGLAEKRGHDDVAGQAALGAALELGVEGAEALWRSWWDKALSDESGPDELRLVELGMVALRGLPGTPGGAFEVMRAEGEWVGGLVGLLGEAGAASVALREGRGDEGRLIEALRAVIADGRPVALSWAVEHAAATGVAVRAGVLGWVVDRVEGARPDQIEARSAFALQAARLWLAASDEGVVTIGGVDEGVAGLASVLGRYTTDGVIDDGVAAMRRAVLLACIAEGVSGGGAQMILDTLPGGLLRTEADLVLALRAVRGMPLGTEDVERLGLLVQGAGMVGDSLRMQLAWRWLTEQGLVDEALAAVLPTVP